MTQITAIEVESSANVILLINANVCVNMWHVLMYMIILLCVNVYVFVNMLCVKVNFCVNMCYVLM